MYGRETCMLCGVDGDEVYLNIDSDSYFVENVKPYLRPMKSMTTEEHEDYDAHRKHICDDYNRYCFDSVESIDWLNSRHFDYRGLIDKGLALEEPAGLYRIRTSK